MDKKIVHQNLRDPKRDYSGDTLRFLMHQSGGFCSHPFCDSPYLSLNAHHIIQHAKGGLTTKPNGLILCAKCHRSVHDGLIPQKLVWQIKYWLSQDDTIPFFVDNTNPEELVNEAEEVKKNDNMSVTDKFMKLNDILIKGNFLPNKTSRYYVFINTIASKVSILNDGTSPLKTSLNKMLISMDRRRQWAQLLAANAFRYAEAINEHWLSLYFIHSRAVGFNARNNFGAAVTEFRKALDYINNMESRKNRLDEISQYRSRLIRETAVCRAKATSRSTKALKEVLLSLDISKAIGESHNIHDALVRCVEGFIYCGDLSKANFYLGKLYNDWTILDDHLKAITLKMDARIAIAQNRMDMAENLISEGLKMSKEHHFNHQAYHFKRLDYHMKANFQDKRKMIIT